VKSLKVAKVQADGELARATASFDERMQPIEAVLERLWAATQSGSSLFDKIFDDGVVATGEALGAKASAALGAVDRLENSAWAGGAIPVPFLSARLRRQILEPARRFFKSFRQIQRGELTPSLADARARAAERATDALAKATSDVRQCELHVEFAKVRDLDDRLARIEGEKAKLRQRSDTITAEIRATHDNQIAKARADAEARIAELRKKLVPPSVKPYSDSRKFPAYRYAMSSGYSDGALP
jgi:hypothetical protein